MSKHSSGKTPKTPERRNNVVREHISRKGAGAGHHQNREYDVRKGNNRKPKHKHKEEVE